MVSNQDSYSQETKAILIENINWKVILILICSNCNRQKLKTITYNRTPNKQKLAKLNLKKKKSRSAAIENGLTTS